MPPLWQERALGPRLLAETSSRGVFLRSQRHSNHGHCRKLWRHHCGECLCSHQGSAKATRQPATLRRAMLGRVQRRASERSLRERTLRCLWLHLPSLSRETRSFGSWTLASSYHVVSRATLESGHVKVLSRKKRPKTVCQTATGDLVEVGSDTHATIEVNFLTTRPIEKQEGVLSTFACTCRLEAVVSDEIKHNLINLNLLCWKGWKAHLFMKVS